MNAPRMVAYGGGAALLIVGVVLAGPRLAERAEELRSRADTTLAQLTAEPEAEAPTIYQRYRVRREAVAAMRADLLRFVAVASAYTADSGHPWGVMAAGRYFSATPGNMGPFVRVTGNGWWATIGSNHTNITCAVVVGPDTTIGNAPPGTPVCVGESHPTP